jgi:hypothetical protein
MMTPKPPGGDPNWKLTGTSVSGNWLYFFWEKEDIPKPAPIPAGLFGDMVI